MRYCNHCYRITAGEPLFCNFCGRSYDYKLCPHRHPNPRAAEICSQCGSRELSTPHPRVPLWLTPLLFLLSALPGLVLLGLSVLLLAGLVEALLTNEQLLFPLMLLGADGCVPLVAVHAFAEIHSAGAVEIVVQPQGAERPP